MTWAKIAAALAGLLKPLLYAIVYWRGEKAGWSKAALEQLEEERRRIEAGEKARQDAEASDDQDPYLRD